MKLFSRMSVSARRALRLAGLGFTVWVVAAPVVAAEKAPTLGREELTGMLVPVTGEVQRSVDLTVPFARDSAKLTAPAQEQLDELGAALAGDKLKPFGVGVYGHTDASGKAAYNQKLSEERAVAVVQYLVRRFSLEPKRFRHAGYGEKRLLTGIDANSPRHRRVEIVVFAPAPQTAPETPTSAAPAPRKTPEGSPSVTDIPSTESAWPDNRPAAEPGSETGGSGVRVVQ